MAKQKSKTQSQKKEERYTLYKSDPKLYDTSAATTASMLLAIVDDLETANQVFPEIFTTELVKQVNLTLNRMYKNNKDVKLCEEHMKLAALFDDPIKLIKSL